MKTTILIINLLFITLTSCNNDDNGFTPTLPPATQSGANTFGCYVDGKLLTPRDGTGTYLGADRGMRIYSLPDNLGNNIYEEIRVRDFKSGTGGIIKIHFSDINTYSTGEFIINESNCEDGLNANNNTNITLRWWNNDTQEFNWYCSINDSGTINITRLDGLGYFAGTFNCTLQNRDNPNDIIEITEGRFDIGPDLPNTTFP